jgi:glucose-1-phosphate cytidylyltransferase
MQVVILAGGMGTRLSEETRIRPKPMVPIGTEPILWHIMRIYARYGCTEFVLALGYLGEQIKEYVLGFRARYSDFTVDLSSGELAYERTDESAWKITLVDTGSETQTGGRLLRVADRVRPNGTFMLTYGDGVADVDVQALLEFHRRHGKLATVTAVRPPARFGAITIGEDGEVQQFVEKSQLDEGWINGGFFVFEPEVIDLIDGDSVELERAPLERLAADGELMAYRHEGFWQCMDTLRDKHLLDELWSSGSAPWKVWA